MYSKSFRNSLLSMCACTALAACAQPTTSAPNLTPEEIAAERAAQEELIRSGKSTSNIPAITQQEAVTRLNRVAPRIQKSGTEICQQMYGTKRKCSFSFALATDQDVLNAWADGKAVYITPKMVAFAGTDEELANVLSHEYAHNVLNHPQSTGRNATAGAIGGLLLDTLAGSQGYDTQGQFSQLGGNMGQYRYSVAFEQEADYVGMYILARAGYDVDGTVSFWRRFTVQEQGGLERSRSHPSNPERTLAQQKTIAEIEQKKKSGQPLLPNLRKK